MEPQQTPENSTPPTAGPTPPQAQPTPPGPVVPQAVMPVAPTQPAPAPYYPTASTGASSSKLPFVFGGIGVLVVLVIAFALAWLLYLSPQAQAKRLSSRFMQAITTGDIATATELTGDTSAKNALTTSGRNVHGSYKLSKSTYTGGKGYYLYDLSGAAKKYARTTIDTDGGKRVVQSFVYSNATLALIPSKSTTASTTTTDTPTSETKTAAAACLVPADFSTFSNLGGSLPTTNDYNVYSEYFQLKFSPDVATYAPGSYPDPTTVLNDLKSFNAQNASKKYVLEISASVNSATPQEQLANARKNKVVSDLQTISGIPSSKLVDKGISNNTGNNSGDSFYRQVQIALKSDQSCYVSSYK